MTPSQSKVLTWIVILGGGALLAEYFIKKAASGVSTAASAVSNTVGGAVASPFEWLYTQISGNPAPLQNEPTTSGQTYFVYDQNGNLVTDSSGNLVTTSYPPGTPQNPYPNPHQGS